MDKIIKEISDHLNTSYSGADIETKKIAVKEYLQPFILSFVYNHKMYKSLNFYGGTSLRTLFDLDRMSEDLDFDNSNKVDIESLAADMVAFSKNSLGMEHVDVKINTGDWGIYRITLKFNILKDLGLSPLKSENLHIKVEISNHKQTFILDSTPVFKYGNSFVARHFSLETLMAGKIIACLERTFQKGSSDIYIKGRDFYDLLWFMSKRVVPYEDKLINDSKIGLKSTTDAFDKLTSKVTLIKDKDLLADLYPLFGNKEYVKNWVEVFAANYKRFLLFYTNKTSV